MKFYILIFIIYLYLYFCVFLSSHPMLLSLYTLHPVLQTNKIFLKITIIQQRRYLLCDVILLPCHEERATNKLNKKFYGTIFFFISLYLQNAIATKAFSHYRDNLDTVFLVIFFLLILILFF